MFGRYQNIFRSRWNALLWAAGVLATAYCSVPSEDDEDVVAKLAQGTHKPSHPPRNPWAKDSKAPPPGN
jgi:hypothetical protein